MVVVDGEEKLLCDELSPGSAMCRYVHPMLGTFLLLLNANSVCAYCMCVGSGDPSGRMK